MATASAGHRSHQEGEGVVIDFVPVHQEPVVLCRACGSLVSELRKVDHEEFHLKAETKKAGASFEDIKQYVAGQRYNQR